MTWPTPMVNVKGCARSKLESNFFPAKIPSYFLPNWPNTVLLNSKLFFILRIHHLLLVFCSASVSNVPRVEQLLTWSLYSWHPMRATKLTFVCWYCSWWSFNLSWLKISQECCGPCSNDSCERRHICSKPQVIHFKPNYEALEFTNTPYSGELSLFQVSLWKLN